MKNVVCVSVEKVKYQIRLPDDLFFSSDKWICSRKVDENGNETFYAKCPAILPLWLERSLDGDSECAFCVWWSGGKRYTASIDKTLLRDKSKIAGIKTDGFSIGSSKAKDTAEFLELMLDRVETIIYTTKRHGDHGDVCVLGDAVIKESDDARDVIFSRAHEVEKKLYSRSGTAQSWIDFMTPICKANPIFADTLNTAFASPLLKILGYPEGFVYCLASRSSTGKTTSLLAATSVYGPPNGMMTWGQTGNNIDAQAVTRNTLPQILSDLKATDRKISVPDEVYRITSGISKGRQVWNKTTGAVSSARQFEFKLAVMTAHEAPIYSMLKSGGAQARTLDITADPFTDQSEQGALKSEEIAGFCSETYGTVGWLWYEFLMRNKSARVSEWKDRLKAHRVKLTAQFGEDARMTGAHRLIGILALKELTDDLMVEAGIDLGVRDNISSTIAPIVIASRQHSDVAQLAIEYAAEYIAMNLDGFRRISMNSGKPCESRSFKVAGIKTDTDEYGLFSTPFREALRKQGYDPEDVLSQWRDRDWLRIPAKQKSKRFTMQRWIHGKQQAAAIWFSDDGIAAMTKEIESEPKS